MDQPRDIAIRWWSHFDRGDYAAAAGLLADDASVDWPVSGERMLTPGNWLDIKEAYPAASPWRSEIVDLVAGGTNVVTFTSVFDGETVDFAISRFVIQQGRITSLTEFLLVREAAAEWRKPWTVPLPDPENPLCRQ